jgi:hypothetical protein
MTPQIARQSVNFALEVLLSNCGSKRVISGIEVCRRIARNRSANRLRLRG